VLDGVREAADEEDSVEVEREIVLEFPESERFCATSLAIEMKI
jgi:hypothetical protein